MRAILLVQGMCVTGRGIGCISTTPTCLFKGNRYSKWSAVSKLAYIHRLFNDPIALTAQMVAKN